MQRPGAVKVSQGLGSCRGWGRRTRGVGGHVRQPIFILTQNEAIRQVGGTIPSKYTGTQAHAHPRHKRFLCHLYFLSCTPSHFPPGAAAPPPCREPSTPKGQTHLRQPAWLLGFSSVPEVADYQRTFPAACRVEPLLPPPPSGENRGSEAQPHTQILTPSGTELGTPRSLVPFSAPYPLTLQVELL